MRWQLTATTWLQVLHARSINRGGKSLTLWDAYGLSEATWEPVSASIQPDGSINPIFRSYLGENNEGQLLTRAETLSQKEKKGESPCAYLFIVPNLTEEFASLRRRRYTPDIPSSRLGVSFRPLPQEYWLPPEVDFPRTKTDTEDRGHTTRPLMLFAAQWLVRPIAPASHHTFSAQCSTKNAPTRWTRYLWGRFSPGCPPQYEHLNCGSPEHAGLR